jgi:N-acetylglutamate synthase-like GNAT family acetyltransferase
MKNSASRRVGHILPYEAIGGTEHATLRLAQVTREAGYENTFFVLETAEESADFFRQAGFELIRTRKWKSVCEIRKSFGANQKGWRKHSAI